MKPAYVILVVLLAVSAVMAQSHGVPASVTSFGFGGNPNAAPGVAASVTSSGPQGYGSECCATRFHGPGFQPPSQGTHHHHGDGDGHGQGGFASGYYPVYYGGYGYYPAEQVAEYQEESSAREGGDADNQDAAVERQARRHSAAEAYDRGYEEGRAAAEEARAAHEDRAAKKHADSKAEKGDAEPEKSDAKADEPAPAPAVEIKTVLVYRDGKKEEVSNYAIVGDQLFDFSDGKRKIAISDLDVPATVKANDARGVNFQLPVTRAKK